MQLIVEPADRAIGVEEHLVHREDVDRSLAALNSLPPRQREVVYLHVCEGLSIAEMADVLDITAGTAKTSLSLGRKRLRRLLQDVVRDVLKRESE